MAKKGKFIVYKKASEKFKKSGRGTEKSVIQAPDDWPQKETDYLVDAAAKSEGRVTYGDKNAGAVKEKARVKDESG